eukprot:s580_g25.t1
MQHVFGCDLRIPQSLLGEDVSFPFQHAYLSGVEDHQRAQAIRIAARRALVAMDEAEAVRKAVHRQSRPERKEFQVGDHVFYWRKQQSKHGAWKGPARIIGFFESKKKIWVGHGNKVLRCSPQQLSHLTEEQKQAIEVVTTDLLSTSVNSKRGAQVFTDITHEGEPPEDEQMAMVRTPARPEAHQDDDVEMEHGGPQDHLEVEQDLAEEFNSDPTAETEMGTDERMEMQSQVPTSPAGTTAAEIVQPTEPTETRMTARVFPYGEARAEVTTPTTTPAAYGPIRTNDLSDALRRSVDILDHGQVRLPRTQLAPYPDGDTQAHEVMLIQMTQNSEVSEKNMTPDEIKQLGESKLKEWDKLLKTQSIKIHVGAAADELRATYPPERFLESRFVKTIRDDPNMPGKKELKCRWCIKGYLDPDLMDLERQSPTLSMEGLSICLQVLASMKWRLIIADVEGAFLQGEPLKRKGGKLVHEMAADHRRRGGSLFTRGTPEA